jgi:hypothetical protein
MVVYNIYQRNDDMNSKDEIEVINFDFIQTCTMEEMAEILANESKNVINDFENFDFKREHKEFWEMWLKQPHKGE